MLLIIGHFLSHQHHLLYSSLYYHHLKHQKLNKLYAGIQTGKSILLYLPFMMYNLDSRTKDNLGGKVCKNSSQLKGLPVLHSVCSLWPNFHPWLNFQLPLPTARCSKGHDDFNLGIFNIGTLLFSSVLVTQLVGQVLPRKETWRKL